MNLPSMGNLPLIGLLLNRYPVDVEIWEHRAHGDYIIDDKGRRRKDKIGRYFYELKRTKVRTKPVSTEFLYFSSKGKNKLKLFSPIPGVYQPMKIEIAKLGVPKEITVEQEDGTKKKVIVPATASFKIIDEDTRRWLAMSAQEDIHRYIEKKSFFEQYGNMLVAISFMTMFIMGMLIVNGNLEHLAKVVQDAANAFQSASQLANIGPPG